MQIAHFHRKQLFYFPCGFSDFLAVLDDKRKKKLHQQENLDKAKDKIKQSVQRMAKQAQGNKMDQKRFSTCPSFAAVCYFTRSILATVSFCVHFARHTEPFVRSNRLAQEKARAHGLREDRGRQEVELPDARHSRRQ